MPTYEYECNQCQHAFEAFQMMSAAPLKKCPKCGKLKLKRLMGMGSGIIFKGPGFYATDYRKGPSVSEKKENSAASSPSCSSCPSAKTNCPHAKEK